MSSDESRPVVLVIGPVPPPAFGVAKATELILNSEILAGRFTLLHLDTSDAEGFANIGGLDLHNVILGLKHLGLLALRLARHHPDLALLTVSQNRLALLRDWLFVSLCRAFDTRVVAYLRGSGYAETRAREGWLAALLLRSILKHSSRVVVLSESLVGMAHAVYPSARVAVVPNGCPPAVGEASVGVRQAEHPVLAYIGWLSREKGLEDILFAVQKIAAATAPLEFVLCGKWSSSAYEARTRELVEEYGLGRIVSFPGPIGGHDKEVLLARTWVLVAPSHSEGQPWVILEAMSAGVPVVATDTGAVAETVADGVTGYVIPVRDRELLATRIAAILENDSLWKKMSSESVRRHCALFSAERSHMALAEELRLVAEGS